MHRRGREHVQSSRKLLHGGTGASSGREHSQARYRNNGSHTKSCDRDTWRSASVLHLSTKTRPISSTAYRHDITHARPTNSQSHEPKPNSTRSRSGHRAQARHDKSPPHRVFPQRANGKRSRSLRQATQRVFSGRAGPAVPARTACTRVTRKT